jgi:hypothetical protein
LVGNAHGWRGQIGRWASFDRLAGHSAITVNVDVMLLWEIFSSIHMPTVNARRLLLA